MGFAMTADQPSVRHYAKVERPHMAQEVRESAPDGMSVGYGPAAAEEFVRNLRPDARLRALGLMTDDDARRRRQRAQRVSAKARVV